MQLTGPSRTAEYMAFFRALESARPGKERLFCDSFAVHFIRPSLRRAVWLSRLPGFAHFVDWYADRRLPGARTSAIARTRLIDDLLGSALKENIAQVVILGSGFDCRPYRLLPLNLTTVYEVDHPATLAKKKLHLSRLLRHAPTNVRFVEIDFNTQRLPEVLKCAGFQPTQAAVFLWEGVANYLTPEAVDSVLAYVSNCPPGSRIIFTYVDAAVLDGSIVFEGARRLLEDVAQLGEPWTFGLDPSRAAEFLRERKLCLECDFSADHYRNRYFGPRSRRMKGYSFYHVAVARVPVETERVQPVDNREGEKRHRA